MYTYEQASVNYKKQFFNGRKRGQTHPNFSFPYGNRYRDETFIRVDIKIKYIKHNTLKQPELVQYYENVDKLEPVWLCCGVKLKDGTTILSYDGYVHVLDGKHRIEACKNRGYVTAIMAESDYIVYKKKIEENDESC